MTPECDFLLNTIPGERRENRRYAVVLDLRYKLTRGKRVIEMGSSRTLDMSSGGISFMAREALAHGASAELWIDWPVPLNGVPLRLVVRGRIVRSAPGAAALRMTRHEFRLANARQQQGFGRPAHAGRVEIMTEQ